MYKCELYEVSIANAGTMYGIKCGEECSEVIIAAKNNDHNELVMEISDLLYHLTVLMVHQNVTVEDINAELEKRSLKSNNLKQFHSVDKNS